MAKNQQDITPKIIKKKKKSKKLTPEQKEQNKHIREISDVFTKIGFKKLSRVDGKHFFYDERKTELDDIYCYENIILLTEYTIAKKVKEHLLAKSHFYKKVQKDKIEFISYLLDNEIYKSFNDYFNANSYTKNQLQIRILYCSKNSISDEHKNLVKDEVLFFDYHIVKYFESVAKAIKKSAKYELFDFLQVPFKKVGENITKNQNDKDDPFSGHILPEEHSSFDDGYKIVSFYIDAENLLKRAYVLRQNGWRDKEGIGHYQRMFNKSKINQMRKYLHENNRVYINNIIATLPIEAIKLFDSEEKELNINESGRITNSEDPTLITPASIKILDQTNILGLIDGQHRTYSYHEGDDAYEETIKKLRKVQNLLVTAILFPKNESKEAKIKYEANLFMEINSTQSGASSQLKQDISLLTKPMSTISIAKKVLNKMNESGPTAEKFEEYWYEQGKLKTSSIVSFALVPLLKLDDKRSKDSLYRIWDNVDKEKLKEKDNKEYDLLNEYIEFASEHIRNILRAFKDHLDDGWYVARNDHKSILSVTTINGILNTLRFLIQNDKISTYEDYKEKLKGIEEFNFKDYKSSQYRKMGLAIYEKYFK